MQLSHAEALATDLMSDHLTGWSFRFDNAKTTAGVCDYHRSEIRLSRPVTRLADADQVRDTVLHEIAHALAGPKAKHGPAWRRTARAIGADPRRTYDGPAPDAPWIGTCPAGHTVKRHRTPQRVLCCGACTRTFSTEHIVSWTHKGEPAVPDHPKYQRDLRLMFPEQYTDTGLAVR